MDQICRYKAIGSNETVYLSHVIIADKNIVHKQVFNLLRHFDNPNDVLVLIADEDQIEAIRNNSIQVDKSISASVYHQIDFKCEMLKLESSVTVVI